MARNHLKRKVRTYSSLASINHQFAAIVRHCWRIERAGFMPILKIKIYRGLVRELQAQISHEVAERMHGIEEQDMFEFGKVRIAWEHSLNPDRPALRQGKHLH